MSITSNDLLILDTNIVVHWVRQDRTGQFLKSKYQLDQRAERPLFSTVSEGEILGLAACWNWGEPKQKSLRELLSELVRFEASSPEVVTAYSEMYYEDQRQGKNTGENDLWIAACARATSAVLLTCDKDFLWLAPAFLRVEHISQI